MNICVFAGSSCGKRGSYQQAAEQLGERLARRAIGLVYGGGSVGLMADLSDAFVVLPGGIGTLDEVFEIWTWSQLGIHRDILLSDSQLDRLIGRLLAVEVPSVGKWIGPAR